MPTTTAPVPTTPAPFADDDPRAVFGRAVALASAVIAAVTPDQLDRPTPCADMDVRAVLGHLVQLLRQATWAGRDQDPDTWPMELVPVADGAWSDAWRGAAHEVQAAWTDDVLDRPTRLPWDTMPGRQMLAIYTNEVVVHTWDLATATGQRPQWDDSVLTAAFAAIRAALPAEGREELWAEARSALPEDAPWKDPFGPAVEVPADAPLIDRLVAWNGRRP